MSQIGLIAGGPQAGGGAGGPDLVNPAGVQNAEQRDRLAAALTEARKNADKGMEMLNKAKTALAKSRADAVTKGSPGGTSITADEQKEIDAGEARVSSAQKTANTLNARSAAAQKALQAWNNAHKAKLGGLIGGSGLADKVPLLAAPGEGVLDHRKMDSLWNMAMEGRRGGGPAGSINVNIYDRTTFGVDRSQARRLADAIAPELDRRVLLRS